MANKSLTDLTARTATADSDLLHINSGGTDYKEQKVDFLNGDFCHAFNNTTLLTTQADALPNKPGVYHGYCAASGHQTELGIPINSAIYITVKFWVANYGEIDIQDVTNPENAHYVLKKVSGTWDSTWTRIPARSEITSLNNSLSQLNVTAGTFVLESAQTSANQYLVIRQSGHVVSVRGYVSGLNCSSGTVEIGTISGVSLPADHVRFLCNYGTNAYSTGVIAYAFVDASNGKLYLYPPSTGTGMAIYFNITWIR